MATSGCRWHPIRSVAEAINHLMRHEHVDPLLDPATGESPAQRYARSLPLNGSPGRAYVEKRGIPIAVAEVAGMRFDPNWNGRAAVLVAMTLQDGSLAAVHGRHLVTQRGQCKMFTIGRNDGVCTVGDGFSAEHLIIVEGAFDALSLATCGWSAVATVGRWAPWLPHLCAGRRVWLAFDANHPGDLEAACYTGCLHDADVRRLLPPPLCKDWNTALLKRGRAKVSRWLRESIEHQCHPATATQSETRNS